MMTDEANSERYLSVLERKMAIKTLSLQAILKPGLAKLYNENGKEFLRSSSFVADFN